MTLTEMEQAVAQAEAELRRADMVSTSLARLLVGRLRNVEGWKGQEALANLKRELRGFNINTKRWKEEP